MSRGEPQVPCPICRKPRVGSQMGRHLEDCHTHEGHVKAQEKGYKRGGKGRRNWAREQMMRIQRSQW